MGFVVKIDFLRDLRIYYYTGAERIMTETLRVLLVEDDKVDQMAFSRFVQKQGLAYDYEIAGSFAEAARLIRTRRFDIVISDYLLGDGTAFDVLDLGKEWPVIVTTGSGDEEIAVRAMKQGAYDYLIKDTEGNYLKMLPVTIANAVKHRRNELELQRYHDELERLVREKNRGAQGRDRGAQKGRGGPEAR